MAVVANDVVGTELEKVLPDIKTLFERDGPFYSSIKKKNVEMISQRQMRIPLEIRPGGSFQYFDPNGGDLGRGGGPTWDKAVLNAVFVSQNIEYTKLVEWATNNDRKAVQNAVRRLTATALTEMQRQLDAQLQGDGTGTVGQIDTVSTSGGVDTYVLTADFGARLVRYGQTIQVYSSDLATLRGKGTITEWDTANSTIQVTPAIAGAVADDYLVVDGIDAPNSLPAIYGVAYHHNSSAVGTWLGFNRASTPEIRSNRVNAGNAALSLPLPRLAINQIGNRVGMDNNFNPQAWQHPCQMQAYEDIGQGVILINKQAKEEGLDLYFNDNQQLAGAPAKKNYNWNKTRIDFVSPEIWGAGEIMPIGFYKTDGRNIFEIRSSSGGVVASDIFYMVNGRQYFVNNPAGTAYISDLAIPAGYN